MKGLMAGVRDWGQDVLLRRVVRNSTYLFASNAISALLSIVTANLLGVATFGVLGIITTLVSNINRLLSFRMGEVVVRYLGEYLERGEKERAAALVKTAALLEAGTTLLGYLILLALAPFAARTLADDPAAAPLFAVYGLSMLGHFATETATGVLQVGNHFRSQAAINLAQSVLVAVLLGVAALTGAGLWPVMLIYLCGKLILGLSPIVVALYWLPRMLGAGWWRAPFALLPPLRPLARYAISTNVSGTINVLARDSETLWISYFFSPLQAGYFRVALALINLIIMPITPFINTTFPEITRAVTARAWPRLSSLLRRVTLIAAGWTLAVGAGLLALGRPLLFTDWNLFGRTVHVYRPEFAPAYPALLILLVGYGFANIFFWNRTLLLALDQPDYPLKIGAITALVKTVLTVLLVPRYGYLMEAALLSLYFLVSVGLTVQRGRRIVQQQAGGAL